MECWKSRELNFASDWDTDAVLSISEAANQSRISIRVVFHGELSGGSFDLVLDRVLGFKDRCSLTKQIASSKAIK